MRNTRLVLPASLALAFFICLPFRAAAEPPVAAPQPYTRILRPDTNTVELQIAIRKFLPAHGPGPALWLVGTAHIGEPEYYHALQKHLDAQTVVLYEGVNADAHPRRVGQTAAPPPRPKPKPPSGTNDNSSIQNLLAKSLGLVFQLDAINYDRTNFLNSDLSIQQIESLMEGDTNSTSAEATAKDSTARQGDSNTTSGATSGTATPANRSFDVLLQIMDGSSFLGSIFKFGLNFIGSDPKYQAITKLMLVETLGGLKGDFSQLRGIPPDMQQLLQVLIQARNEHVVKDVKTELGVVPDTGSISVFFGTGHMDDMERRVIRELDYHPAGDTWYTAFSVDLRRTGMSPSELDYMRNLVKWQLDQMQK